ncbi:MAG: hypothetical protein V3T93_06005 [Alphaproteobacteria bacterium]
MSARRRPVGVNGNEPLEPGGYSNASCSPVSRATGRVCRTIAPGLG